MIWLFFFMERCYIFINKVVSYACTYTYLRSINYVN